MLIISYKICQWETADRLVQLGEHPINVREVAGSISAGPTRRVFELLRRKCCLCNDICKRLDFLVFLDKDDKP